MAMEMPHFPDPDSGSGYSAGVQSATTGQGKIVQMAKLDQNVMQRLKTRPMEYEIRRLPIGNLEDHNALQFEPVFQDIVPPHEASAVLTGAINTVCFTSFNGRDPSREPIRFLGFVLKPAYLGQGQLPDVTYQMAGTLTVVNTGDGPIPENSLVYWDAPDTTIERGMVVPSHQQHGKPASKFIAALRSLNIRDVGSRWQSACMQMEDAMHLAGAWSQNLQDEVDRIADRFVMMRDTPERDPFRRAGRVLLGAKFLGEAVSGMLLNAPTGLESATAYEDLTMAHGAYLKGAQDTDAEFGSVQETYAFESGTEAARALSMVFQDHLQMYYNRVVGKAISGASRGGQFDILIRAGL